MLSPEEPPATSVDRVPSAGKGAPLRTRLVVGGAYVLAATIVGQGLALATSIIYARLLGSQGLGTLAIYSQIASLAVALASLGLAAPTTRFVAQLRVRGREELERFLSTVLVVTLIATVATASVLFVLAEPLGLSVYGSSEIAAMVRLAMAFLVVNALTGLAIAILQGLQAIRVLSLVGIGIEAMTVPVMFVALSYLGLLGAAVGGVTVVLVASCFLLVSLTRRLRAEGVRLRLGYDHGSARDLFRFATPHIVSGIVIRGALLYQGSFLAVNLGYTEIGLFTVASTISRIIAFVPAAISVPLLPAISELYATASADRTKNTLTTLMRMTSHAGIAIGLVLAFAAGPLIVLLYGAEYAGASVLAFLLVIAGFLDMVNTVAMNSLLGEGRTGTTLLFDAVQALVITVGTTALVVGFGLLGVGFARILTALAYAALALGTLARTGRIDLHKVGSALAAAALGFSIAAVAFVLGDAQTNLWLGAMVVAAGIAAIWISMPRRERRMAIAAASDLFRGGAR